MLACCRLHLWRGWLDQEPEKRPSRRDWLLEYLATAAWSSRPPPPTRRQPGGTRPRLGRSCAGSNRRRKCKTPGNAPSSAGTVAISSPWPSRGTVRRLLRVVQAGWW